MQHHWKEIGGYGTLGLEIALSVLVGLLGGQWLDGRLGTGPWLTLLGACFGVATGFRFLWRALRRANREAARADEEEREERRRYHARGPRP